MDFEYFKYLLIHNIILHLPGITIPHDFSSLPTLLFKRSDVALHPTNLPNLIISQGLISPSRGKTAHKGEVPPRSTTIHSQKKKRKKALVSPSFFGFRILKGRRNIHIGH